MTQPTNLIQPYTATVGGHELEQRAKIELDEEASSLLPGEYIFWLAHIPPDATLVEPFYSNDLGSFQVLGKVNLERSQEGLVLDNDTRSISLEYYPTGDPAVVFFGAKIPLNINQLRSGIVVPQDSYDGKQVYKFSVIYQVAFYRIRHRPNHPDLIKESDGGVPWEEVRAESDDKSSFPIEFRAWWK